MSFATSGQVLITDTVRTATIGSKLDVDDAGDHTLKGVPASCCAGTTTTRTTRQQGRNVRVVNHPQLVAALRDIHALSDVGSEHNPNFHFRGRPFLHFHTSDHGTVADVRFGLGDFEEVDASTPAQREALLDRVARHVRRIERGRKDNR